MTNWNPVPVPAIVPEGPLLSLRKSAVKPNDVADQRIQEVPPDVMRSLPQDVQMEIQARAKTGPAGREAWTRGFTWAPENRYPAEARAACDYSSIDLPALPAPTGLVLTQGTGGTLANGTYKIQVTATNANGETTPCALQTIVIAAGGGTASIVATWEAVADNAGYNVYGRVSGSIGLIHSAPAVSAEAGGNATYTDLGSISPGAAPPVSNTTGGSGTYTNQAIQTCIPWVLVTEDWCSTFGFSERDFKGRATRLLENSQDYGLEREFWTGALAQQQSWPNNYLTAISNDLTGGTPPSVLRGQQILQDYLQSAGFGGRGMIHCQPQAAPNLLTAQVNPGDEQLKDIFGNEIVIGSGYPGTGPGGTTPTTGTTWMYATDLVSVRIEDDATVFPETFAEATDWGQAGQPNTIRFRAMKFGAAYADFAVAAAINVTLAT